MDKYTVKSTFTVANQLTHVNLTGARGDCSVVLPIKWAQYLIPGTRFDIFVSQYTGMDTAYKFKNNLYFPQGVSVAPCARRILCGMPGVRDFSLEKMRFKYALLMALQSNGVKPQMSWVNNIMTLDHINNQR